jgi:endoglucanase
MYHLKRIPFALLAALLAVCVCAPAAIAQNGDDPEGPVCGLPLLPPCEEKPPPLPPPVPKPPPAPVDHRGIDPASANPLLGLSWFVDKTWAPQYKAYRRYKRRGQSYKAAMVAKVALNPQFKWFGRWNEDDKGGTAGSIRAYLERVQEEQPGSVAQVVIMRHQGKACHKRYTAGGAREDERTKRYYREFARGIGNQRVVIGFEPDSLGTIDCLAKSRRKARIATLAYGVDVLSQLPNATVYIEAGASDWESPARTAKLLRQVGVAKVRGFMLNVTHYDWTAYNNKHGADISRRVGGKHFIVSTSFNGRGPVHYKRWINRRKHLWRRVTVWCHPLRRGLGIAPTTQTNHPLADAYLYIGRPGFSGGSCNGGPLPVGSWFGDRAVMFGRYATNWLRPPSRTRFGHPRGLSLKAFAGDQLSR